MLQLYHNSDDNIMGNPSVSLTAWAVARVVIEIIVLRLYFPLSRLFGEHIKQVDSNDQN